MTARPASRVTLSAAAALALGAGVAWGQNQAAGGPVVAVPEGPPVSSAPSSAVPDGALPAPDLPPSAVVPSGPAGAVGGDGQAAPSAIPAGPPAQVKPIWVSQPVAVLDVLDKADGAVTRISAPVGSSFTQGQLRVAVGACEIRPPDMPPDAAVYVSVSTIDGGGAKADAKAGAKAAAPLFRGWLIRSEPGATVVGDAAVTFRLIGCKGG